MILCDIGNSTFNFYATNSKKKTCCLLANVLPSMHRLQNLDKTLKAQKTKKASKTNNNIIYFISVNKKATKKLCKFYKQKHTMDISKNVKFKTSYKNMGIDKKFACLGIKNKIVIDAGSAINVDVIKNNIHLGGYLFLGLREFVKSYKNINNKLKVDYSFKKHKHKHKLNKIPTNTKDAIHLAVLKSLVLFVEDLSNRYKISIIITGGDGEYLSYHINNAQYSKNLIFKSMQKVINKTITKTITKTKNNKGV